MTRPIGEQGAVRHAVRRRTGGASRGFALAPASPAQRGLYFLERLDPGGGATNVTGLLSVEGGLDAGRLRRALDRLADRHDALRTTIAVVDGEVVQRIAPSGRAAAYEFLQLTADKPAEEAERQAARGFDLERGPLWRVTAVRARATAPWTALAFTFHHAIIDEESMAVFGRELALCYADPEAGFATAAAQYTEFAVQLADRSDLEFWSAKLADVEPLALPYRRAGGDGTTQPPAGGQFAGGQAALCFSAELQRRIVAASSRRGLSPYMFVLAALAAALHRLCGQSVFVIGTPVSLRPEGAADVLGNFSNTALLRFSLGPDTTLRTLLRDARRAVFDVLEHRGSPFERVVAALRPRRDGTSVPFVQVALVYNREAAGQSWTFAGAEATALPFTWAVTDFDVTVSLAGSPGADLTGHVTYRRDRFAHTAMAGLAGTLQVVLEQLVDADDAMRLRDLAVLDPHAREELIRRCTALPESAAPGGQQPPTVLHLFDAAADRTPGATAVEAVDGTLSFGSLRSWSDAIAAVLAQRGTAGRVVAVCVRRRRALVAAMFGVWRSASTVLLLDPSDPAPRLRTLLSEAGAGTVLIDPDAPAQVRQLCEPGVAAVETPREPRGLPPHSGAARLPGPHARDAAYVMFTSGSTGIPKGVVVEHHSLAAHAAGQLALLLREGGGGAAHRVGGTSAVTFDTFMNQVSAIALGHTLVLIDERERLDLPRVVDRNDHAATAITWFDLTPRQLELMIEAGLLSRRHPPRVLVCGGEAVPQHLWDTLRRSGIAAFNTYGPTECTIDSTFADLRAHADPTIGRPYGAARVYIADGQGALLPAGFAGQICIGGPDVARGYLAELELTAARFKPDPYVPGPDARIYLTGDLGRLGEDGGIEYLGRADGQLKVRGIRVEPGEIEAVLGTHPAVRDCAVVTPNGTGLVAFVVAVRDAGWTRDPAEELRAHAAERLPATLVPDRVVLRAELPLTPQGKADRTRLAELHRELAEPAGSRPLTAREEQVAGIMAEVLELPAVGGDDDFFRQGGDSIRALALMVRLRARLGLHIDPVRFMRNPTVAAIAASEAWGLDAQHAVEGPHLVDLADDEGAPARSAHGRVPDGAGYLLVPSVGGSVLPLRQLARLLAPAAPVAALEWSRPAGGAAGSLARFVAGPADRLAAAAARFAPRAPVIVGWSLGGMIGHAVAVRLERLGAPVRRLVLLDSRLPNEAERAELSAVAEGLGSLAARLAGRDSVHGLIEESGFAGTLAGLGITAAALAHHDGDAAAQLIDGWRDVLRLVAEHRPTRLRCEASLLLCAPDGSADQGAAAAWSEVCGKVTVGSVRADHFSMLQPPADEEVVRWLLAQTAGSDRGARSDRDAS